MATNPVKTQFTYTIKDFHKEHVRRQKERGISPKDGIQYKAYKKIFEDLWVAVCKKIIYENFTFIMGHRLGHIRIKAFKYSPTNSEVDFHNTKKYNKVIKYINRHTFGMTYRRWWGKDHVVFKNRSSYVFSGAQGLYANKSGVGKKNIAAHIKHLSETPDKRSYINL